MRQAGLAALLSLSVALMLASCGEERVEVEEAAQDVAAPADLSGVQVEMHQAPG